MDLGVAIKVDDSQAIPTVDRFEQKLVSAEDAASRLGDTTSAALANVRATAQGAGGAMDQFILDLKRAQRETTTLASLSQRLDNQLAQRAGSDVHVGASSLKPEQAKAAADEIETFLKKANESAVAMANVRKNTAGVGSILGGQVNDAITKFKDKVAGIGTDIGKMAFGFAAGELLGGLVGEIIAPTPPTDAELAQWVQLGDNISDLTDKLKAYAIEEIKRRELEAHQTAGEQRAAGFTASTRGLIPDVDAVEKAQLQLQELNRMLNENRDGFSDDRISAEQYYRAVEAVNTELEKAQLGPYLTQVKALDFAAREYNDHLQQLMGAVEDGTISQADYDRELAKAKEAFEDARLAAAGFSGEIAKAISGPFDRYDQLLENQDQIAEQLTKHGMDQAAAQKLVNQYIEQAAKGLPGVSEALSKHEQAAQKAAEATKRLKTEFDQWAGQYDPLIKDEDEIRKAIKLRDDAMRSSTIGVEKATQAWENYILARSEARQAANADSASTISSTADAVIAKDQAEQDAQTGIDRRAQLDAMNARFLGSPEFNQQIEAAKKTLNDLALSLEASTDEFQHMQQVGVAALESIKNGVQEFITSSDHSFKAFLESLGRMLDSIAEKFLEIELQRAFFGAGIDAATGHYSGGLAGLLGLQHGYDGPLANLPHYAGGVDRMVGGPPGTDKTLVAFWASYNERLKVQTPAQAAREASRGGGMPMPMGPTKVINVFDQRDLIEQAIYSPAGQDAIMNVIATQPNRVKRLLP